LPNSRQSGLFRNIVQANAQPEPSVNTAAPAVPASGGRAAPTRAAVRPEPAAGLDGWLMDRLFGR
jgi:penicillin-binding protein 1A